MYPEITLAVGGPEQDIFVIIAELKLKIYRILPTQDANKIKIILKDIQNTEKCLNNR